MPDELRLSLRITADGRGVVGEVRRTRNELDRLERATRQSTATSRQAGGVAATLADRQNRAAAAIARRETAVRRGTRADREATRRTREATRATRAAARADRDRARALRERTSAAAAGLGLPIGGLGIAGAITAGALAARAAVGTYFRAADSLVTLNSSLGLVTESEAELARVREGVIDISRGPYAGALTDTAALYSRLTLETRELGLAEAERLRLIETIRQSAAIGGGGPGSEAAVTQLLQGIGAGVLRGEELNSLLEQAPGLSIALIEGFQTLRDEGQISIDVTRANLRALAADGELTADRVTRALLAAADSTEKRYSQLRVTVGEQWRLLRQEIDLALAGGEGRGFSDVVQQDLAYLTELLQTQSTGRAALELLVLNPLRGVAETLNPFAAEQAAANRARARGDQIRAQQRRERFLRVGRTDPGPSPGLNIPSDAPGVRSALDQATRFDELERGAGRGRQFLALQRELLTAEEQIQAAYEDSVALIREYASEAGVSAAALIASAAAKRDEALATVEARKAAEAEAQARADGTIATREAEESVRRLAAENARIASGGSAAVDALEAEAQARQEIQALVDQYPGAAAPMLFALTEEHERRQSLLSDLTIEQGRRAEILGLLQRTAQFLPNVASGITATETVSLRNAESLHVWAGAISQVEGALGQLAATHPERAKKLFRTQQTLAYASAVVNTAAGVTQALAAYTPPLSFVLAGLVAAAGAIQVAAIQSTPPPQAFRYGGIIDRRTEFEFGGGRRGLAGEAGPEAILPLRRGPGGALGVQAVGAGDRTVVIHLGGVQVSPPAGTSDPTAFGREAGHELSRVLRPVVREVLLEEQRPGGSLNRSDRVV
ncbi:MAG: tape measure protein [Holophagales bacterium]|nr:tape measure protein [Holophagales bacterium]MYC11885.1 tape measure protein [Holophagales bacterium]